MRTLLLAVFLGIFVVSFVRPAFAQVRSPQSDARQAGPILPEIVVVPAPSFSSLKLKLSRTDSHPDERRQKNIAKTFEVQIAQPFKSSPYGAPVTEAGLGAVQSAQLLVTLRQSDLIRRDGGGQRSHPVDSLQFLAAVGHRGFDIPGAPVDHVDRVPYAFGLELEHRPGNPKTFAGHLAMGLGVQYRRQYLPPDPGGAPVAVDNVIVDAAVGGAMRSFPGLPQGLGYRLKVGYDVARGVPGAELALTTAVLEYPRLIIGVSFWFQGRDNDPRTRDKRFDLAPHISLQF